MASPSSNGDAVASTRILFQAFLPLPLLLRQFLTISVVYRNLEALGLMA